MSTDCLQIAHQFLAALERGAIDEALSYYAPDVVQQEFPNRLVPQGATRELPALREGAQRGQQLLSVQRYEVLNAVATGNRVAMEVRWTGRLAISLGSLAVGDELRAHLALFFDFAEGRIVRQRNYDCYDP